MAEFHTNDWTPYRVGNKSSNPNFVEITCSPLERVMHVTHVRHALSVVDDGRLRRRLVYDESRLNSTRIHVVWLSPNDWTGAGGSRYGGVQFEFEWRSIIEGNRAYWIGVADYEPRACRILLSTADYSKQYLPYDPTRGDGPWWHEQAVDKHWWNGRFCLEVMLERDVELSGADGMSFTKHHSARCNVNPGGHCRDANREPGEAGSEFISGWAAGIYANRYFPISCRPGIVSGWSDLVSWLDHFDGSWGKVGPDDLLAPMLGRALLSAIARRDIVQRNAIARQFLSRDAAARALARIVALSFDVDESSLSTFAEEGQIDEFIAQIATGDRSRKWNSGG